MNKVSVIIPTYNQFQYLPICIDSIWFQNYSNIEIIVVNDGSNDETEDVISQYLHKVETDQVSFASNFNEKINAVEKTWHDRYPKEGRELTIIEHEQNMGLGAALNTGFKAATGKYCTYIASDDFLYPCMIEESVRALEEENVDFVYADINIVDDSGRIMRQFNLPDYSFERCFCNWYMCGVCQLYKRSLHDKLGYYREDLLANDHELFLRFAMNGVRFLHVPKVLAGVRHHGIDREIFNHAPENWHRLYEESKSLIKQARQFLR